MPVTTIKNTTQSELNANINAFRGKGYTLKDAWVEGTGQIEVRPGEFQSITFSRGQNQDLVDAAQATGRAFNVSYRAQLEYAGAEPPPVAPTITGLAEQPGLPKVGGVEVRSIYAQPPAPTARPPQYTPRSGIGARATRGNTIYEFTDKGWVGVASAAFPQPDLEAGERITSYGGFSYDPGGGQIGEGRVFNILAPPPPIQEQPLPLSQGGFSEATPQQLELATTPEALKPSLSWLHAQEAQLETRYSQLLGTEPRTTETGTRITRRFSPLFGADWPGADIKIGSGVRTQAAYFGAGAVSSIVGLPRFVYQVATQPKETATGMWESFWENPEKFSLETAGAIYGGSKLGVLVPTKVKSSIPKVKYGKVEVPFTEGGPTTIYKGLYVTTGRRTAVIAGKGKGGWEFGTPSIDVLALTGKSIKEGYVPVTPFETKVLARKPVYEALGYDPVRAAEQVRIKTNLMGLTEKQSSAFIEKRLPEEVRAFKTKEGVKETLRFAKSRSNIVDKFYGSFTMMPQLLERFKRLPGDIDIFLKTASETEAIKFSKDLAARLRKKGERVRISEQHKTLVETLGKDGQWHHAVDVHYVGEPPTPGDLLRPKAVEGAYGVPFEQPTKQIGGQPVMRLSESGLRKGAASLIWLEKGLGTLKHRAKDLPDFYATQSTLIESMKVGRGRVFRRGKIRKGERLLTELEGLYPDVELGKKPVEMRFEVPLFEKPSPARARSIGKQPSPITSLVPTLEPSIRPSLRPSTKPSARPSMRPSRSPSPSVSNVLKSISPYPSTKPSKPVSPYTSPPSKRPSQYPSIVPSRSIFPYPSVSKSPSKSPSPYISPDPKPSDPPYPSVTDDPTRSPPSLPPAIFGGRQPGRPLKFKRKKPVLIKPVYKASLLAVIGGVTAKKAPGKVTGLGIRPVITNGKRRRLI